MIIIICIILQRSKSFDFVLHISNKINAIKSKISELSNIKHTFYGFEVNKIEKKIFLINVINKYLKNTSEKHEITQISIFFINVCFEEFELQYQQCS